MVLAAACIGKVLGTLIVAKLWRVENRKAIALGFLMNTKGLVELIVLNIGLSKGVISRALCPHSDLTVILMFSTASGYSMAKISISRNSTCCITKKSSTFHKEIVSTNLLCSKI